MAGFADVARLGHGPLGDVYRVTRTSSRDTVAVRVFAQRSHSADWRRVEHDIQQLAGLRHASAVNVIDVIIDDGIPHVVMDLAEGGSVTGLLTRRGTPLSVVETILIGEQTAGALAAAHRHGILHRAVRAHNVLFDVAGRVKLSDLGFAALRDPTQTGRRSGVLMIRDIAPEVTTTADMTEAADVYQLGAMLTHLTRDRPGGRRDESDADRDAAERMRALLTACLAPSPRGRPSAAAVRDELGALAISLGELSASAATAPPPDAETRTTTRAAEVPREPPRVGAAPPQQPKPVPVRPARQVRRPERHTTTRPPATPVAAAVAQSAPSAASAASAPPATSAPSAPPAPSMAPETPVPQRAGGVGLRFAAALVAGAVLGSGGLLLLQSRDDSAEGPPVTSLAPADGSQVGSNDGGPATPVTTPFTTSERSARSTAPVAATIAPAPTTQPVATATVPSPTTATRPQSTSTSSSTPTSTPRTTSTLATVAPPPSTGPGGVVIDRVSPRPTIASVSASDVRGNSQDSCGTPTSYEPELAVDGSNDTAWMTAGDGSGDSIMFALTERSMVSEVGLVPGYDKFDPCTGSERFEELRRITSVRWSFDDGTSVHQAVEPTAQMHEMRLPGRIVTGSVTMTVLSTTAPGEERLDHTAVSEVAIR